MEIPLESIVSDEVYDASDAIDAYEKAIIRLEMLRCEEEKMPGKSAESGRGSPVWNFINSIPGISPQQVFYDDLESDSKLQHDIEELTDQIRIVQQRQEETSRRRATIKEKREKVNSLKKRHKEQICEIEQQILANTERLQSVQTRENHLSSFLDSLDSINVVNDCFHIWFNKEFATMSGFRLGHLGNQIDWQETNSALGQCAMALDIAANLMGLEFSQWQLLPLGSYSRLRSRVEGSRTVLNLYMEEGFSMFKKSNFNKALQAYLACLAEAGAFLQQYDPTLQFPHALDPEAGTVGGLPVALWGDEPAWNRAMKRVAADLKWALAWGSKYAPPGGRISAAARGRRGGGAPGGGAGGGGGGGRGAAGGR